MTTLMEATQHILDCKDPAGALKLADGYMRMWADNPNTFVLPKDHAFLALRDEVYHIRGERSEQYINMQALFRTAEVRLMQFYRRDRLRQCVEWFIQQYPHVPAAQRRVWARKIEQQWAKRRLATLSAARKAAGGMLTEDERRVVLDEFWADVDTAIKNGDLPPYE